MKFIKLLERYSKLNLNRDILSYDWHNLSSGQNAYLDMISRIYMIQRNELLRESLKNVIFLIDEGDLYLHPSAQVQFLKNLLELINRIFHDKKIHVIITTNSPFIISDIKNDNVIYVTSNEGQVTIEKNKNSILTFGANVNELLIDSFYMDMGTKGTFSTGKINSIKELLQMDDDEFMSTISKRNIDMDDIKILIESIGEEIVRNRLLEMYWKKKSLMKSESDGIIDKLYKEFENLDNHRKRKFLERVVTKLK
ncbi:AAA family ATPase, partial [Clostridium butyricum]|uniref:AAA family ATPase n=1 Tax=Clostridium butyricum TaxID=1492 RepID=UPI00374EEBED